MIDYKDLRVFMREGRHLGVTYKLTVYAISGGKKFALHEIAIDGAQPEKGANAVLYDTANEAFEDGHVRAKTVIGQQQ